MATPLVDKLQIKPGMRLRFLNPPRGFSTLLGALPEGTRILNDEAEDADFLQLFASRLHDVERHLATVRSQLVYDGVLWISWPKKRSGVDSDLSREVLVDLLATEELRPVTAVSVDEIWSALRFRPVDRVGT